MTHIDRIRYHMARLDEIGRKPWWLEVPGDNRHGRLCVLERTSASKVKAEVRGSVLTADSWGALLPQIQAALA